MQDSWTGGVRGSGVRSGVRIILETGDADFVEVSAVARIPWGRGAPGALLAPVPDALPLPGAPRLIIRTGFLPDEDHPDRPDPRTWGPRGWEALEAALRPYLARDGARILLRPAHTDVLSDAPSCIRFLDRREQWGADAGERLGILLDPAAMIAPSMIPTAEDHIARILEIVANRPGVDGVVAANIEIRDDAPAPTPLHRGSIPPARLAALFRANVPAATPLILTDVELEKQRAVLDSQ